MTITVGVPYWRCADYIERCVRSLLAQTIRDVVVVVIGDGEDVPLRIRDDRLVTYRLPENRGAYFAQSVILGASPHQWYAPHGADDWSEPDHLERLLARTGGVCEAVATGAVWWHKGDAEPKVHEGLYEVGIFSKRRLEAIGGYNPAERIGQDTLTLRLLRITGSMRSTTEPTYHRLKRPDALTTAPETRIGSVARNEMRARNREVYAACSTMRRRSGIRDYRASLVPPALADELALHVARLGALL